MKIASLLKKVDEFYKLAIGNSLSDLIENHKVAIRGELGGGIRSINSLVAKNPMAAKSEAIRALDETFGNISSHLYSLTSENAVEIVPEMLQQTGQASFYTSKANVGTGFDPLTWAGGAGSPAAYLERIKTHLNNLSVRLPKNAKQTAKNIA